MLFAEVQGPDLNHTDGKFILREMFVISPQNWTVGKCVTMSLTSKQTLKEKATRSSKFEKIVNIFSEP